MVYEVSESVLSLIIGTFLLLIRFKLNIKCELYWIDVNHDFFHLTTFVVDCEYKISSNSFTCFLIHAGKWNDRRMF
jgi:hypothetical protein